MTRNGASSIANSGKHYQNSQLIKCTISNSNLTNNCTLTKCTLTNCTLTNCTINYTSNIFTDTHHLNLIIAAQTLDILKCIKYIIYSDDNNLLNLQNIISSTNTSIFFGGRIDNSEIDPQFIESMNEVFKIRTAIIYELFNQTNLFTVLDDLQVKINEQLEIFYSSIQHTTKFDYVFAFCIHYKVPDLTTTNITSMVGTFALCGYNPILYGNILNSKLNQVLSDFPYDTQSVTNMDYMFFKSFYMLCDISKIKTDSVTSMNFMLYMELDNINFLPSNLDKSFYNLIINKGGSDTVSDHTIDLSKWDVSNISEFSNFIKIKPYSETTFQYAINKYNSNNNNNSDSNSKKLNNEIITNYGIKLKFPKFLLDN